MGNVPEYGLTRFLQLIWDEAADEVRMRGVQHAHEVVQRLAILHRDRHHRRRLPLLLATATYRNNFLPLSSKVLTLSSLRLVLHDVDITSTVLLCGVLKGAPSLPCF